MNNGKHIIYTLIGIAASLFLFEFTSTDLWLQRYFFDLSGQHWIWSGNEPITRLLLYDGIKVLLVLFALALVISLFFQKRAPVIYRYRRGIRIVLLSLILVPLCIASLKATTNVACPRAVTVFGGELPYIKVFEHYPAGKQPTHRQRCFPAGHASGGFALMSLFFLFESARNKKRALFFSLGIGWLMGSYKMLIGDHYLSHTIITMLIAWLIINVIVIADKHIFADT